MSLYEMIQVGLLVCIFILPGCGGASLATLPAVVKPVVHVGCDIVRAAAATCNVVEPVLGEAPAQ